MKHAQQTVSDFARSHGLTPSAQGRFMDLVSEIRSWERSCSKRQDMRRNRLPIGRKLQKKWATVCFRCRVCATVWSSTHRNHWNWRRKNMRNGLRRNAISAPEKIYGYRKR